MTIPNASSPEKGGPFEGVPVDSVSFQNQQNIVSQESQPPREQQHSVRPQSLSDPTDALDTGAVEDTIARTQQFLQRKLNGSGAVGSALEAANNILGSYDQNAESLSASRHDYGDQGSASLSNDGVEYTYANTNEEYGDYRRYKNHMASSKSMGALTRGGLGADQNRSPSSEATLGQSIPGPSVSVGAPKLKPASPPRSKNSGSIQYYEGGDGSGVVVKTAPKRATKAAVKNVQADSPATVSLPKIVAAGNNTMLNEYYNSGSRGSSNNSSRASSRSGSGRRKK